MLDGPYENAINFMKAFKVDEVIKLTDILSKSIRIGEAKEYLVKTTECF